MPIFYLQIAILLASGIWFNYFEFQFTIKRWLNIPEQRHVKLLDCFTCTNFHLGWIIGGGFLTTWTIIYEWEWIYLLELGGLVAMNYIIGNIIDHIKYKSNGEEV